jgi:hypothetical protein
MPNSPIPEQGQLVEVRRRQYVVTEVAPGILPPSPLALSPQSPQHVGANHWSGYHVPHPLGDLHQA